MITKKLLDGLRLCKERVEMKFWRSLTTPASAAGCRLPIPAGRRGSLGRAVGFSRTPKRVTPKENVENISAGANTLEKKVFNSYVDSDGIYIYYPT